MQNLLIQTDRPLNILCLGAHCDDIEIGCGGTLLELTEHRKVKCNWVVFCSNEERAREAQICAENFLKQADSQTIWINQFKDGFMPYNGSQVKDYFEKIKNKVTPDIIFTHYRDDKHQDHRLLSELTLNTFRDHLILEYEIPKYDGDLGRPNCYMPVSQKNGQRKITEISTTYQTQYGKNWFTEDLFHSLMRIRGMESNSPSRLSEAFYCHKMILNPQ